MSGGGYRATIFHAGALRRLNELGLLYQVKEISSVSGGSITTGELAVFYKKLGGRPHDVISTERWNKEFAEPIHELTGKNIRSRPILEKIFLPWNWFRPDFGVQSMASELDRHFGGVRLIDLGEEPDFIFQATDLSFGVSWEFRPWRVGSYKAGYLQPPPDSWSLGQAVAASAAFPPVFAPMVVPAPSSSSYESYYVEKDQWDKQKPARRQRWKRIPADGCWKSSDWPFAMQNLRLQDGGVYDNLALEPIWKDRKIVLVSDAGGPFSNQPDQGLFKRGLRWTGIIDNQSRALRKRMLIGLDDHDMTISYWATDHPSDRSSRAKGYSAELAEDYIAQIRTDLDVFSEAERAILENHGYLAADEAIFKTVCHRKRPDERKPDLRGCAPSKTLPTTELPYEFAHLANSWPALNPPHLSWLPGAKTECQIKKALFSNDSCKD
ncbi:MAG TPA: patatin-like phospholipase family protein [Gemmatimonadales bacterium]|nr:patatin-like phospholipase family protein [Gemmatimonadales bacterium]